MPRTTETTLNAFSDGFGGMAVTDVDETDPAIVQLLTDESPWDVIDGIEKLPRGHYRVKLSYWHEDNFPESGYSLITEVIGHEIIQATS